MKRRALDLVFSTGALAVAGLLLAISFVMTTNANFARDYVKDQLTQQHITFKTLDTLTGDERRSTCLVATPASS